MNTIIQKRKNIVWIVIQTALISFIILGSYSVTAQETKGTDSISQYLNKEKRFITGTVIYKTGPLSGVNVFIKGRGTFTQTDSDGNYSIDTQKGDILEFSYTGCKQVNVIVESQDEINVTMKWMTTNVIVCVEKRTFFGRMFHSIGNIFR